MKREERKVYNSLKKTVTGDTLYVEIPTNWTHEARQAIHELLTVEKGMVATVIGPDCCTFKEAIRYTHSSEATKATRQAQEVTDIDEVMKELRHTDYTWNGYKANEEEHATEEPAKPKDKKGEKTMNEAKKELLSINPHALQGLHSLIGYDFQQPHAIAHIEGRFTVNSALKAIGGANRENVVTLLVMDHSRSYLDRLNLITVDSLGRIDIDTKGGYRFNLDKVCTKGTFEDIRKSDLAECFIICQRSEYIKKPQEKPFDTSTRYKYVEGKDRKTGDGNGKSWISNITVRALDGSNREIELTKEGHKETYSRVIYRRPDEARPQTRLDIIDKSGYLLPERRADLLRRADQLRKERAKAAYQATDNAEKVAELRTMVEQKKREFSEAIMNAANSEELRNAAHELYFKFMWTMSEFERFADKTARRDYVSIDAAESAYNHIKNELKKEAF